MLYTWKTFSLKPNSFNKMIILRKSIVHKIHFQAPVNKYFTLKTGFNLKFTKP
jgi:hypothetical protein